jgi:hypothetical protein
MIGRRKIKAPDGVEWQVGVYRVKRPRFRQSDFDPATAPGASYAYDPVEDFALFNILEALFRWFILPIVWLLPQYVWNALRSIGADTRWVEAYAYWPREMRMIWRTDRDHAAGVRDYVIENIPRSEKPWPPYGLAPSNAQMISKPIPLG